MTTEEARLEEVRLKQAEILKSIRDNRWTPPPGTPDSVELLRLLREEREAELMRRTQAADGNE